MASNQDDFDDMVEKLMSVVDERRVLTRPSSLSSTPTTATIISLDTKSSKGKTIHDIGPPFLTPSLQHKPSQASLEAADDYKVVGKMTKTIFNDFQPAMEKPRSGTPAKPPFDLNVNLRLQQQTQRLAQAQQTLQPQQHLVMPRQLQRHQVQLQPQLLLQPQQQMMHQPLLVQENQIQLQQQQQEISPQQLMTQKQQQVRILPQQQMIKLQELEPLQQQMQRSSQLPSLNPQYLQEQYEECGRKVQDRNALLGGSATFLSAQAATIEAINLEKRNLDLQKMLQQKDQEIAKLKHDLAGMNALLVSQMHQSALKEQNLLFQFELKTKAGQTESKRLRQRLGVKGRIGQKSEEVEADSDKVAQRAARFGTVDRDTSFVDETSLRKKKRKNSRAAGSTESNYDSHPEEDDWANSSLPSELVLTKFGEKGPVPADKTDVQ